MTEQIRFCVIDETEFDKDRAPGIAYVSTDPDVAFAEAEKFNAKRKPGFQTFGVYMLTLATIAEMAQPKPLQAQTKDGGTVTVTSYGTLRDEGQTMIGERPDRWSRED